LKNDDDIELIDNYVNMTKILVLTTLYDDAKGKIDGTSINWSTGRCLSMSGIRRINNVQSLVEQTIFEDIPGDFFEAGCWKGGMGVVIASVFTAHNQWSHRAIWQADSFEGLPSSGLYKASLEDAVYGFRKLGFERKEVKFLKGWFKDTFPPIAEEKKTKISVLRIDGDIYQSTIQAFIFLYPLVSVNGFVIIDDYVDWEGCRKATLEYRKACGIDETITLVYFAPGEYINGIYWRKKKEVDPDCWRKIPGIELQSLSSNKKRKKKQAR